MESNEDIVLVHYLNTAVVIPFTLIRWSLAYLGKDMYGGAIAVGRCCLWEMVGGEKGVGGGRVGGDGAQLRVAWTRSGYEP